MIRRGVTIAPLAGGIAGAVVVIGLGIGLVLGGACADDGGPRLEAVVPAAASPGAIVTVTGQRLCGESADCASAGGAIRIGLDDSVQANIVDYNDTTAQIRIPSIAPIGPTVLVATVNERASNALEFEVLPPGAVRRSANGHEGAAR